MRTFAVRFTHNYVKIFMPNTEVFFISRTYVVVDMVYCYSTGVILLILNVGHACTRQVGRNWVELLSYVYCCARWDMHWQWFYLLYIVVNVPCISQTLQAAVSPHIDSFNYMLAGGLRRAVTVSTWTLIPLIFFLL